jgi:hypothetical protein
MGFRLGLLWKPVVKGGYFPASYVRVRDVARSSEKVRAVNRALASAARGCKGKHTRDGSFQRCVGDALRGKKF